MACDAVKYFSVIFQGCQLQTAVSVSFLISREGTKVRHILILRPPDVFGCVNKDSNFEGKYMNFALFVSSLSYYLPIKTRNVRMT